jgi:hypothetical protein
VSDAEQTPSTASLGEWAAPAGAAALTAALGAVAYVILYVAAARFYAPFGLRPEDVGLTYPTLLVRSLGAGVLLALLYAGAMLITWPFFVGIRALWKGSSWAPEELPDHLRRPGQKRRRLDWTLLALLLPFWLLCVTALITAVVTFVQQAGAAAVIVAFIVGAAAQAIRLRTVSRRRRALLNPLGWFLLVLVLVGATREYLDWADEAARSVRQGQALSLTQDGLPFYAWRATPARIATTGGRQDRCLLYLGESSSAIWLFSVEDRRTLRRAPDTAIEFEPTRPGCPSTGG